jgi:hypothetical protein
MAGRNVHQIPKGDQMKKSVLVLLTALLLGSTGMALAQTRDLAVQEKIAEITTPDTSKLKVRVWVDPDHPELTYKLGEAVTVYAKPNFDAYITVTSTGPTGEMVVLYPNEFQEQALVKAGTTLIIPGKDAPAQIIAAGTPGVEQILVTASTVPGAIIPEAELSGVGPFKTVAGGIDTLTRSLEIIEKKAPGQTVNFPKAIVTIGDGTEVAEEEVEEPVQVATADDPVLIGIEKSEFAIDEVITMSVTTPKDCYLWVIDVASDNSKRFLFPNQIVKDNFVKANTPVAISGGDSKVKIVAQAPAGTETVYALCTDEQNALGTYSLDTMFSEADSSNPVVRALVPQPVDAKPAFPEGFLWAHVELVTK